MSEETPNGPDLGAGGFYTVDFRDRPFVVATHGSDRPAWLMESFLLEESVRERWWDVKSGDVVLDVGAGFGSYTLSALALGASLVVALEPAKEELYSLCLGAGVNNWSSRLVALPVLARGDTGVVRNYSPKTHRADGDEACEVRLVTTVDRVTESLSLRHVDWLKIDVEGDELEVLQGAVGLLKRSRPNVLVECHEGIVPGVSDRAAGFLAGLGYARDQLATGTGVNDHWTLWKRDE